MKRFINFIGSRRFAVILLVITTAVMIIGNLLPNPVLMTPGEAESFIRDRPFLYRISNYFHVMNITKRGWFLAIPFFIFISVSVCTYRRVKSRGISREMPSARQLATLFRGKGREEAEVRQYLEGKGWKVETRAADEGVLIYGRKGDGGIWGSALFHIGINIVIVGAVVSMITVFTWTPTLTEGFEIEPVKLLNEARIGGADAFPYRRMLLESFEAVYKDGSLPVDYKAVIAVQDGNGKAGRETIKVNQPLRAGRYQFALTHYSFTPRFTITEKGSGRVIEDAFINLVTGDVNQSDSFYIPEIDVRIQANFFPDFKKREDNLPMTMSRSPNNPVYLLKFYKGGGVLGDGLLHINKRMDFDEGRYTIEFKDLKQWVRLYVSRDYGLLPVEIGLFLILSGLAVRFAMNEKRAWVILRGSGDDAWMKMGGRTLYFPALFDGELKGIAEDLGLKNEDRDE